MPSSATSSAPRRSDPAPRRPARRAPHRRRRVRRRGWRRPPRAPARLSRVGPTRTAGRTVIAATPLDPAHPSPIARRRRTLASYRDRTRQRRGARVTSQVSSWRWRSTPSRCRELRCATTARLAAERRGAHVGLLGSIGFALALWLRGDLALLGARAFRASRAGAATARRARAASDFLLVALALFQMVLAANLTDSIFLPAAAARVPGRDGVDGRGAHALDGDDRGRRAWSPQRAFAPRLMRTTLLASAGSVVLALVIFLFLPALHSGALLSSGAIGGSAAGFSDRISLGDLGRIRPTRRRAARRNTSGRRPAARVAYYRGLAFDHLTAATGP